MTSPGDSASAQLFDALSSRARGAAASPRWPVPALRI